MLDSDEVGNLSYSVSRDNGLSWSSETALNPLAKAPLLQDGGSIVTYSHGVFMAVWYWSNQSDSTDQEDVRLSYCHNTTLFFCCL